MDIPKGPIEGSEVAEMAERAGAHGQPMVAAVLHLLAGAMLAGCEQPMAEALYPFAVKFRTTLGHIIAESN
jgi:hypothetical protein